MKTDEIKELFKVSTIIMDADDTLWYDNIYYSNLKQKLFKLLPYIEEKELNSHIHALIKDDKGKKLIQAITEVSQFYNIGEEDKMKLELEINKLRNYPIVLLPYVKETINLLKNYTLFLTTMGDFDKQIQKILRSGLSNYFDSIFVLKNKDISEWEKFYTDKIFCDIKSEDILVIGNSLKKDIIPNQNMCVKTLWLDHKFNTFGRDYNNNIKVNRIKSWKEIYDALKF